MNAEHAYDQVTEAQWVVNTLENIFRPIVRMLFSKRIGYQTVVAVMKRLYVEQAFESAASRNPIKQPSVSSVSVSSGVDVKDVKVELDAIRKPVQDDADLEWLSAGSAESKILEHWAQKPPFVDNSGKPVELGGFGPGLTFERLVKRVCGNVGPAELRDRLCEAGCIEVIPDDSLGNYRLRLVKPFFTATSTQERSMIKVASIALRHLATCLCHNVSTDDPADTLVQQERWTHMLRREDLLQFREQTTDWVRERVKESEGLIEKYEKDPFARDDHVHAGIGIYYFEEGPGARNQFQYAT
jgi:hypothetical protein